VHVLLARDVDRLRRRSRPNTPRARTAFTRRCARRAQRLNRRNAARTNGIQIGSTRRGGPLRRALTDTRATVLARVIQ